MAFFFLKKMPHLSYEQCVLETILFAGDTDTNGAIVGGMIGAFYGRSNLPLMMVDKVLNCDLKKGTQPNRPPEVLPSASFKTRFEKLFLKIPR
jgi:ADP-ribosylglycohydrolase